jgi:hypothetical protein
MDLSSALWPGKICAATASPITQTLFPVVLCLSAGNPANFQEIDKPICIPMRSAARFIYTIWENVNEQFRCGIGTTLNARIE